MDSRRHRVRGCIVVLAAVAALLAAFPGSARAQLNCVEVINQDYIRTAESKGLSQRVVIYRHALKNALIPIVTLMGLHIRIMVGGSVLVETVFSIPGMGFLLVGSAINKDYLVVQGSVLMIGAIVCLSNLLVDIIYGWLDPRLRYE